MLMQLVQDTTVKGANSTALPHTSIADIKDSVLLYTRIGIDMSKRECACPVRYS
jgi:hypothetical protein